MELSVNYDFYVFTKVRPIKKKSYENLYTSILPPIS